MGADLNALGLAHRFLKEHIRPGDTCIDATAGRGNDTAFLCSLVGPTGHVTAIDVQQQALDSTKQLLTEQGFHATLVLDSHSNMANYAEAGSVDAVVFNFGWLPGADHSIMTRPESSIAAILAGLSLLRSGGVMSLCIYYGRDSGFEERDQLLDFFKTLDNKVYTVLVISFPNRPNNPPFPVFIIKE